MNFREVLDIDDQPGFRYIYHTFSHLTSQIELILFSFVKYLSFRCCLLIVNNAVLSNVITSLFLRILRIRVSVHLLVNVFSLASTKERHPSYIGCFHDLEASNIVNATPVLLKGAIFVWGTKWRHHNADLMFSYICDCFDRSKPWIN